MPVDVEILGTIADLRSYDGSLPANKQTVEVLGYYTKDDSYGGTFYWDALSTATDDGGFTFAVIGVATGRWIRTGIHDKIDVTRFGAKGDGSAAPSGSDDGSFIRKAVLSVAKTIIVPVGSYYFVANHATDPIGLDIPAGKTIIGVDKNNCQFYMDAPVCRPIIVINADNVVVSTLKLRHLQADNTGSIIKVLAADTLNIENCILDTGFSGVAFAPPSNSTICNVIVQGCEMMHLKFGLYIGVDGGDLVENDHIFNVLINNNIIRDGATRAGGDGDGIKTLRRCDNLVITNNIITTQLRDALDLFVSGDKIIIADNVLKDNLIKGLDIKSDRANYPPGLWGTNGQQMTISNNLISGNASGISIAKGSATFDYNYVIDISHNQIFNNTQTALNICAEYINIIGNMIFNNCLSTATSYHAVKIGDNTAKGNSRYVNISDNVVLNNGNSTVSNYGIYISAYCEYCNVKGNTIRNDINLENPYQNGGLYVNLATKEIGIKDNIIKDHLTQNTSFQTGFDAYGVINAVTPATIAAGTAQEFSLMTARVPGVLLSFTMVLSATITANATDYASIEFQRKRGVAAPVSLLTYTTATNTVTAFVPINNAVMTAANRIMLAGDVIIAKITHTGTGQQLLNPSFTINYIET